jgi:hypothetical protein
MRVPRQVKAEGLEPSTYGLKDTSTKVASRDSTAVCDEPLTRVALALHMLAESARDIDPALARLASAWPTLPDHVRRTILAIVESTAPAAASTASRSPAEGER